MKNKNEILQNEIKEINLNLQKTREEIGNYAKQSVINTFRRFDWKGFCILDRIWHSIWTANDWNQWKREDF